MLINKENVLSVLKKYLYSEEENHICDVWREKGTIDQVMKVFDEVVFELWVSMGDSTMNKLGYTNATVFFHKDIMGIDRKKVEEEFINCEDFFYV